MLADAYSPKVNDYVRWKDLEGWVYFYSPQYITIEIKTTPKDETNVNDCPIHRNNRVCVLCYHWDWNQLEYITSRSSIHEQSQQVQNRLEKTKE